MCREAIQAMAAGSWCQCGGKPMPMKSLRKLGGRGQPGGSDGAGAAAATGATGATAGADGADGAGGGWYSVRWVYDRSGPLFQ